MEPKKITYICKYCKYTEIKQFPDNNSCIIPNEINCPNCNKLSFEIHNPTYLERMKNEHNV